MPYAVPAATAVPARVMEFRIGDLDDGSSYRKAVRRVCMRLSIPIWFPHQFRHTAADFGDFRRMMAEIG